MEVDRPPEVDDDLWEEADDIIKMNFNFCAIEIFVKILLNKRRKQFNNSIKLNY